MSAGSWNHQRKRPRQRLGAVVLLAYALSLVGVAVHFALVEHTVDSGTGRVVGLHEHTCDHTRDHAPSKEASRVSAPPGQHDHGPDHCHFADHLTAGHAVGDGLTGPEAPVFPTARGLPAAAPARADGQRLLDAPKHSPPA